MLEDKQKYVSQNGISDVKEIVIKSNKWLDLHCKPKQKSKISYHEIKCPNNAVVFYIKCNNQMFCQFGDDEKNDV